MQNWMAVTVFAVCFLVKVSTIWAAESAPESTSRSLQEMIQEPAASTTTSSAPVHNNITVNNPQTIAYKDSNNSDAATVLGAKATATNNESKLAVIPMIGGGDYVTRWSDNTSNTYSLGLAIDFRTSDHLSLEMEGGYSRYSTAYTYYTAFGPALYQHNFNQYILGVNGKIYVVRSIVSPYLGAGIAGVYYENMDRGPYYPGRNYSQWIGSGQLLAGADIEIAEKIAVGIRGSYLHPLFNRPQTRDDGAYSYPFYEDAALINTGSYRILGTMTVRF